MWRITLQDEQVMDREFVLGYHASNHLCWKSIQKPC
jgi:hypothetical protein